jgi:hypothetical protein
MHFLDSFNFAPSIFDAGGNYFTNVRHVDHAGGWAQSVWSKANVWLKQSSFACVVCEYTSVYLDSNPLTALLGGGFDAQLSFFITSRGALLW